MATKISERAQQAAGLPVPTNGNGKMTPHAGEGQMTGPPPDMDEAEFRATAGQGLSTKSQDNIVPIIYILHYSSPLVDERDTANYIQGARPGDLLLRGAPEGQEVISADQGNLFQPCYFWNDVTERVPRKPGGGGGGGGKFVAKHQCELASEVYGAKQGPKGKFHWVTADGVNDLEDTRNFAGFVYLANGLLRLPFLIQMKGTGHAVGRAWMTKMNSKLSPSGEPYASYAALYRLRTEPRSNDEGRWFLYTVADGRWATKEERAAGAKLHQQFKSGEKRAEDPVDENTIEGSVQSETVDQATVDAVV